MSSETKSNEDLILDYLESMSWAPESIDRDGDIITITVKVQLDYKLAHINLRFENNGLWLSIMGLFMKRVDSNITEIYKKVLEINYSTTMTKFGLNNESIFALVELPLYSLEFSEFQTGIRRLTNDMNKYFPIVAGILNA